MKKADVDRTVEGMTTNRMRERTKALAEQAGFVLWDGAVDWSSNYDDELEQFAELVRADEHAAIKYVLTSDTSEKHVHESDKDQHEWVGLDPEQMRNTPIEFNRGALWAERYLKEKNRG